LNMR
jgi:hypothetical protein